MENGLPEIRLKAIGTVHNEIKDRERQDVKNIISEIVLDPGLTEALDKLEDFSHVIVIYFMHQSRKPFPMKVHPRYSMLAEPVGVFASRSPDRPNPLGKTIVELLERHENVLTVRGLDAMDATPVLDIKPYLPGLDAVKNARMPSWMKKS
ncbi:MAG: tRNA (N6-threonylcarbamoyladenosine(37)-N6)-methyltransferase TrmO [Dehalococcoidales bacterium]|jgi:tRNA-Thr(GGU) m(6)t(6)A37 methyltransferase TsaA